MKAKKRKEIGREIASCRISEAIWQEALQKALRGMSCAGSLAKRKYYARRAVLLYKLKLAGEEALGLGGGKTLASFYRVREYLCEECRYVDERDVEITHLTAKDTTQMKNILSQLEKQSRLKIHTHGGTPAADTRGLARAASFEELPGKELAEYYGVEEAKDER